MNKLEIIKEEYPEETFLSADGFEDAIIGVAEKIPNNVLEEDPKLLMWYDQAVTRMGG